MSQRRMPERSNASASMRSVSCLNKPRQKEVSSSRGGRGHQRGARSADAADPASWLYSGAPASPLQVHPRDIKDKNQWDALVARDMAQIAGAIDDSAKMEQSLRSANKLADKQKQIADELEKSRRFSIEEQVERRLLEAARLQRTPVRRASVPRRCSVGRRGSVRRGSSWDRSTAGNSPGMLPLYPESGAGTLLGEAALHEGTRNVRRLMSRQRGLLHELEKAPPGRGGSWRRRRQSMRSDPASPDARRRPSAASSHHPADRRMSKPRSGSRASVSSHGPGASVSSHGPGGSFRCPPPRASRAPGAGPTRSRTDGPVGAPPIAVAIAALKRQVVPPVSPASRAISGTRRVCPRPQSPFAGDCITPQQAEASRPQTASPTRRQDGSSCRVRRAECSSSLRRSSQGARRSSSTRDVQVRPKATVQRTAGGDVAAAVGKVRDAIRGPPSLLRVAVRALDTAVKADLSSGAEQCCKSSDIVPVLMAAHNSGAAGVGCRSILASICTSVEPVAAVSALAATCNQKVSTETAPLVLDMLADVITRASGPPGMLDAYIGDVMPSLRQSLSSEDAHTRRQATRVFVQLYLKFRGVTHFADLSDDRLRLIEIYVKKELHSQGSDRYVDLGFEAAEAMSKKTVP
eukprot:TRINITY_DN5443_c0_g2_i1.p1 TRINITY_DN5443_c0_g2~~TRINITY_DN5443_c0_g2_i1.p1  ORF type:complete len:703 (+),score=91.47 TRINITY_DN5443_c0_g2_i1:209-2110(+)